MAPLPVAMGVRPHFVGPAPTPCSPQRCKRRPLRYQKMRRPMTAEQQLERSVLESKEREELHAIAQAMDIKTTTRSKKADLIDQILSATGVPSGPATNGDHAETNGSGPKVDQKTRPSSRSARTASMEEIEAELDATIVTNGSAPSADDSDGDEGQPPDAGPRNSGATRTSPQPQRGGNRPGNTHGGGQPQGVEPGNRRNSRRRRGREPGGER